MRYRIRAAVVIWFTAAAASTTAWGEKVQVTVRVPKSTPATDSVYVAGSLPSAGEWKPDGVKLTRQPDGNHTGELELQAGETLEFKITRGTWATVEKNADGSERDNRSVTIDATTKKIEATVARWSSVAPAVAVRSVVGTLNLHKIQSKSLKGVRTIRVWLPSGYDAAADARFGVLYIHDGQNCFDRATSAFGNEWQIDETLTRLIAEKRVRPIIVVGIDNALANRTSEYTYAADPKQGSDGGNGAGYATFLLSEVKPFVEKTYRTQPAREHTFIAGSSLGGLISLEIARRHKDTFGGVIAMSPAVWWGGESLTADVKRDAGGLAGCRVWIDMGSREGGAGAEQSKRFIDTVLRLNAALAKYKIERRLVIDDKHPAHNEPAWAARFPEAIEYVLGETK